MWRLFAVRLVPTLRRDPESPLRHHHMGISGRTGFPPKPSADAAAYVHEGIVLEIPERRWEVLGGNHQNIVDKSLIFGLGGLRLKSFIFLKLIVYT